MAEEHGGEGFGAVDRSDELTGMAGQLAALARGQVAAGGEYLKEYVRKEPLKALGIAVGLGILVGWWTKRR